MGERPIEAAPGAREDEGASGVAIASLGFPVVFLTLLAHGVGIYVVRQGYWIPGPFADKAWTAILVVGIGAGLCLSACRGHALRRN